MLFKYDWLLVIAVSDLPIFGVIQSFMNVIENVLPVLVSILFLFGVKNFILALIIALWIIIFISLLSLFRKNYLKNISEPQSSATESIPENNNDNHEDEFLAPPQNSDPEELPSDSENSSPSQEHNIQTQSGILAAPGGVSLDNMH